MQAWFFLFALLFVLNVNGHSMMTCAVLDGNKCVGAVRDASKSLASTNYRFDNVNPCQQEARGVSNLANKYSTANPMGKLRSGQQFTIQWTARNHAVANQNPRVVKMYLSPAIQSGQTNDYSWDSFKSNMFCTGPYINCGNGANVDATGDGTPCTLTCTLPTLADGTYTMLWHWNWTQNDGSNYMTCADLQIGANNGNAPSQTPIQSSASSSARPTSASSSAQQSSSSAPQTSAQRTSASSSAQQTSASSSAQQSSSQQQSTRNQTPSSQASSASKEGGSTLIETSTEATACPNLIERCKDTCGDNGITTCSCAGGQFTVVCREADTDSSSSILTISALILTIIALL